MDNVEKFIDKHKTDMFFNESVFSWIPYKHYRLSSFFNFDYCINLYENDVSSYSKTDYEICRDWLFPIDILTGDSEYIVSYFKKMYDSACEYIQNRINFYTNAGRLPRFNHELLTRILSYNQIFYAYTEITDFKIIQTKNLNGIKYSICSCLVDGKKIFIFDTTQNVLKYKLKK